MLKKKSIAAALCSALISGAAWSVGDGVTYTRVELPYDPSMSSTFLNDNGEVLGMYATQENGFQFGKAGLWKNGVVTPLNPTVYPAGTIPICPHASGETVFDRPLGLNNDRIVLRCQTSQTVKLVVHSFSINNQWHLNEFDNSNDGLFGVLLGKTSNYVVYDETDPEGKNQVYLVNEDGGTSIIKRKWDDPALAPSLPFYQRLLNDNGTVIGSPVKEGETDYYLKWKLGNSPNVFEEIKIPGLSSFILTDINNAEQIIGYGHSSGSDIIQGFIVNPDKSVHFLGSLGATRTNTKPTDINDDGIVVGCSDYMDSPPAAEFSPFAHPFQWQNGMMVDRSNSPNDRCDVAKINNQGDVAWSFRISHDDLDADDSFYLIDHAFIDYGLGPRPLPERYDFNIKDLNELGDVIETSPIGISTALWVRGTKLPVNTPPVVSAGPDKTIKSTNGFVVNGTATDVDGDTLTYRWLYVHDEMNYTLMEAGTVPSTGRIPLRKPEGAPLGTHTYQLEVNDGKSNPVTDRATITVYDTTPPNLTLWNPSLQLVKDGTMQERVVSIATYDNDGKLPALSAVILSNQPVSGLSPNDQAPDWTTPVISADGKTVTFSLRGEVIRRAVRGYTLKVTAKDQSGNVTTKALRFEVKL